MSGNRHPFNDAAALPFINRPQDPAERIASIAELYMSTRGDPRAFLQAAAKFDNATAQQIMTPNINRRGATIFNYNTGAAALFILLSDKAPIPPGATTTPLFTHRIAANGYYEMPFKYTGAVWAIWDSIVAGSCALVTELF